MKYPLVIKINVSPGRCISLYDVLKEIENDAQKLYWSLFFLNASGDLGGGRSMVEFQENANNLVNGYFLSWDELLNLAKKFNEVIEIRLVGSGDKEKLIRYKKDAELFQNCEIVIDVFDGYLFEIYSSNNVLMEKLRREFC